MPKRPTPKDTQRSTCPVACALDILGDRWTLLVIRDLFAGKRRFSEFLESPEHIPTNILADRLKRLLEEQLVQADAYTTRPVRYEYTLTKDGRGLARSLSALADWGERHFPGTQRGPAFRQNQSHQQATQEVPAIQQPATVFHP